MGNYKQKYEEALENLKKIKAANKDNKALVDFIEYKYPELKESEDEKIRKELVRAFTTTADKREHEIYGNGITYGQVLAWLEKQGEQKPTNKVEPKFYAGDFISDGERIFQIKETIWERNNRNDGTTYCESLIVNLKDGITYANNTDLKEYHLWTIQDAKEGDVLYYKSPSGIEYIVMSSGVNRFGNVDSYFRYNSVDGFGISVPSVFSTKEDITPATKEQRDLLFSKMKEAGYEWDAEKKELKKMGQEENAELTDFESALFSAFSDAWQEYLRGEEVNVAKWAREHSAELLEVVREQNPAWSEIDFSILDSIICVVEEWENNQSAEEKEYYGASTKSDWLKSLKERCTWKPSNKQMDTLQQWLKDKRYDGDARYCFPIFDSLYHDLKKLRKE